MSPELIEFLIQVGVQAFERLQALKTSDPAAFAAALQQIGEHHRDALARLEAAAAP